MNISDYNNAIYGSFDAFLNNTIKSSITEWSSSTVTINDTINNYNNSNINYIHLNNNSTNNTIEYDRCNPRQPNLFENFNCTKEEFLIYSRGHQTLDLHIALPFTIFYVGTFIAGILGNVIVCIVIIRHSTMHTATNYYLFSLAVSDLIYLMLGLPYDLSLYWYQYPYLLGSTFCKLRALVSEACTYVSVLTIVAFSMERFLAICHPLHLYAMSGFKRAVRIIVTLWVISFLSAIPFGLYSEVHYLDYPKDNSTIWDSAFCAMLDNPPGFPLWEMSTIIFFALPMIVMIVLYGRMGLQIRFRSKHTSVLGVQQGSMHNESKQTQSRKAIIRMLAAVVITFFISWAPFHAQRLMYLYFRDWPHFTTLNTWLFLVGGLFYYFSCTINPILYNVMSHRYRVAFQETLCGKKKGHYHNNGFSREAQSSVRETIVSGYENSHLARIRSLRQSRYRERDSVANTWGKKALLQEENIQDDSNQSDNCTSDMVVVNVNGRTKCYTTPSKNPMGGNLNASSGKSTLTKELLTVQVPVDSSSSSIGTTKNVTSTSSSFSNNNKHETCI